jgi:hypothetical protein
MGRRGLPVAKTGTDPAANAEISETVPAGKYWEVISVTALLVQGATQTPFPILILDDGTTELWEGYGAAAAQDASTTARYTWSQGGPGPGALLGATPDLHANAALPKMILGPGYRVRTNTVGKGANTNWGAPRLLVVEYDGLPEF